MHADAPSFQHQLDWALDGETLMLDLPRERAGPVRVLNAITLDGNGCTVWAQTGPVVHVVSGGVTLRNLRIEQTGDDPGRGVALKVDHPDVELDRVTVRGVVVGLKAEEGVWRYPHQLNLGTVAPGAAHTVRVRVVVPVPCKLTAEVSGVTVRPRSLAPGRHEVQVVIEAMRADTLVSGTLTIETAFLRREIVLNAHSLAPAAGLAPPSDSDRLVWQPEDWDAAVAPMPSTPAVPKASLPPVPAPSAVPHPRRPTGLPPDVEQQPPSPAANPPVPIAPPPVPPTLPRPPVRGSLRSVKGPLLGALFTSPPIGAPPPAEVAPPPETAAPTAPPEPPSAAKKLKPPPAIPSWAKGSDSEPPQT
jgi:hypothetical protein